MEERICSIADDHSLVIREALSEDALALMEFLPRVLDETDCLLMAGRDFDKSLAQESDFLAQISRSATQLALVGYVEDTLVALLTFTGRDLERVRHAGEVGLMVSRDWWGRGIGTQMMHYLHDWARANDEITKIDLRVRLSNRRAITLYESLGYQIEGWIRRAIRIGDEYDDHYWMGLELPLRNN